MLEQEYLIVSHLTKRKIRQIFSNIQVNPETECWEWTLKPRPNGYGFTYYKGKTERIHRILYAWLVEPIRRGHGNGIPELDHVVCNNRKCCNPAHLKLVTHRENSLRGNGLAAQRARQTHCKNGHELPKVPNTKRGRRRCNICHSAYNKANELKHKFIRST